MAAEIVDGPKTWAASRDDLGHREYKIKWHIRCDRLDGPAVIFNTPGLPTIGTMWQFDNDLDQWAFCHPQCTITPLAVNEPNEHFEVEQTFSTKPLLFCQNPPIDDPLLQPQVVSGSFTKYTKEVMEDRYGDKITSSSHELPRGEQLEFDHNRPSIKISQNVAALELDVFSEMVDTLNDAPLWGLPARCIKLSNVSWERKVYGTCGFYYTRNFEFDIRFDTFDRDILDEGCKVLHGHWDISTAGLGTGCTLDITADSLTGDITAATITTGGSGYPESATIQLLVVQPDSSVGGTAAGGGIITVTTDATGVVTAVSAVASPGIGYTSDTGVETSSESTWILDDINGAPPDPDNPQHFQRFKDRKGENARTLLNGAGCPLASSNPEDQAYFTVEYYDESNFLLLGIPTTF